jgi:hypothetical protein
MPTTDATTQSTNHNLYLSYALVLAEPEGAAAQRDERGRERVDLLALAAPGDVDRVHYVTQPRHVAVQRPLLLRWWGWLCVADD